MAVQVRAKGIRLEDDLLHVLLTDGREISVPFDKFGWLKWLAGATPEQRAKWRLEPNGFAVYWDELDDGIEIEHLLSLQPLV